MLGILIFISWIVFAILDIRYFSERQLDHEPDGWVKYLIAFLPGSGFYYKWKSMQK